MGAETTLGFLHVILNCNNTIVKQVYILISKNQAQQILYHPYKRNLHNKICEKLIPTKINKHTVQY